MTLFLHFKNDFVKVILYIAVIYTVREEKIMATIIETSCERRTIRLTTDDIISIVQEYQQLTKGYRYLESVRDILENKVLYLPETK